MAVNVTTLLIPPDGSGEINYRWYDWLPVAGSGQTQKEAVIELLAGFKSAAEALLTTAEIEITDPPVIAYIYWKAFGLLCLEYGRRVGSTTIHNELTTAVGTATARPFCDMAAQYKLAWEVFVPATAVGSGSGVSASVKSHFTF